MKVRKNRWSSVKMGIYTVKYSKTNKTWRVWRRSKLITDFNDKKDAVKYMKSKYFV